MGDPYWFHSASSSKPLPYWVSGYAVEGEYPWGPLWTSPSSIRVWPHWTQKSFPHTQGARHFSQCWGSFSFMSFFLPVVGKTIASTTDTK